MSYSRTYSFYVSGSVHYPASQHGGSVSYSDSVTVEVFVDTAPFDASVATCTQHVGALCNTVIDETDRIGQEKAESSRRIASSLIGGFFRYIMYGISDKIMRLGTRIPILQKTLQEQAAACLKKRTQMEADYQSITTRYAKIFDDLDTSLKKALVALDRPAFDVAALTDRTVAGNCLNSATSAVAISGAEESNVSAAVTLARLKLATRDVVTDGARNIRYNIELASRIEHMLRRSKVSGKHAYCMPVIQVTADDLESGGRGRAEFFFPGQFPPTRTDDLLCGLRSRQGDGDEDAFRQVGGAGEGRAFVDSFFKKRLSAAVSRIDDAAYGTRLSNEVLRMWNAVGRGRSASAQDSDSAKTEKRRV